MTQITQNTALSQSLEVNLDSPADLLQGAEGRKYSIYALNNTVNPVVNVRSNWLFPNLFAKSAVIENLIIDGQNLGVTGILLQNAVQCQIRNVTIKNCEVGIHLRSYFGLWSEVNFLKHIRMENVTKGIVFTTTGPYTDPVTGAGGPGDSAGFTTIDDVGISLANRPDAVGIQIGGIQTTNDPNGRDDVLTTTIKPYSSRIKANVWMGNQGGTGLKIINGELLFAQAHLTVTGPPNGVGIDIQNHPITNTQQDRVVWYNQFSKFTGPPGNDTATQKGFMLTTSGINTPINPPNILTDIQTKTF
jgi:hypothetical protein